MNRLQASGFGLRDTMLALALVAPAIPALAAEFADPRFGVTFTPPAGYQAAVDETASDPRVVELIPSAPGEPALSVQCSALTDMAEAAPDLIEEIWLGILRQRFPGVIMGGRASDARSGARRVSWELGGESRTGRYQGALSVFVTRAVHCAALIAGNEGKLGGGVAAYAELMESIRPVSAPASALAPGLGLPEPRSATAASQPAREGAPPAQGELGSPPAPAAAAAPEPKRPFSLSDLVDTRLTFAFSDDNLLAGAGETSPSSPAARIGGGRQNTLFFDNYETRFTGYESLSHLVLYRKQKTFIEDLTAEAALVWLIQARDAAGVEQKLVDDSSYVRANYKLGDKSGWSLVAFPNSADRMRLGYSYKISWGGSAIFPNQRQYPAPGAKVQLSLPGFYVFGGVKTTLILNERINEPETNYGFLGGVGFDITDELRLELNGGYFDQGVNPKPDVLGLPVQAGGGSVQLAWHVGTPVGSSVDFKLYKNDPDLPETLFRPESYPGGLSFVVATELTNLVQTLAEFERAGSTARQVAWAADLQVGVKYDFLRMNLILMRRDLAFIQFNVPGLPPFMTFPKALQVAPETMGAFGLDYHFAGPRVTPGLWFGLQRPASITGENALAGNNPTAALSGKRTQVVRDQSQVSLLPAGEDATLVLSAKATARIDLSESLAAAGDLNFTVDNNRTRFRDDERGVAQAVFDDPYVLGFNLVLQARF